MSTKGVQPSYALPVFGRNTSDEVRQRKPVLLRWRPTGDLKTRAEIPDSPWTMHLFS